MLVQRNDAEVGVVIGRFHVDDLHKGHRELLDSVAEAHERLIILLGLAPFKCTLENPLDFESRRMMIQNHYPEATVMYIRDVKEDDDWSCNLDDQLNTLIGPGQRAQLYGSRDSFIPYYSGQYPVQELTQETYISGTEIRRKLAIKSQNTKDFRAGVIWGLGNQYPSPKPAVDLAIFNDDGTKILLGRKKAESSFRFIGGFVDNGETWEMAATREGKEETGLDLHLLDYIGSYVINDWRVKGKDSKITTTFFRSDIKGGKPTPGDDIFELKWFDFDDALLDTVIDTHKVLMTALLGG